MDFDYSEKVQGLRAELTEFMDEYVYPNEKTYKDRLMASGERVSEDFPLAHFWAESRILRLADGPDEVHRASVAKLELKKEREGSLITEQLKSN